MRRLALAAVLALVAGLTAGCSDSGAPPSAASPKDGRVTITWSNCVTGSCTYDWKICVGPDLLMHIDRDDHWLRGSEECA